MYLIKIVQTLNQLQALSNSNLKGSKLNNVQGKQTTKDFVIDNLDIALNNLKTKLKIASTIYDR